MNRDTHRASYEANHQPHMYMYMYYIYTFFLPLQSSYTCMDTLAGTGHGVIHKLKITC